MCDEVNFSDIRIFFISCKCINFIKKHIEHAQIYVKYFLYDFFCFGKDILMFTNPLSSFQILFNYVYNSYHLDPFLLHCQDRMYYLLGEQKK